MDKLIMERILYGGIGEAGLYNTLKRLKELTNQLASASRYRGAGPRAAMPLVPASSTALNRCRQYKASLFHIQNLFDEAFRAYDFEIEYLSRRIDDNYIYEYFSRETKDMIKDPQQVKKVIFYEFDEMLPEELGEAIMALNLNHIYQEQLYTEGDINRFWLPNGRIDDEEILVNPLPQPVPLATEEEDAEYRVHGPWMYPEDLESVKTVDFSELLNQALEDRIAENRLFEDLNSETSEYEPTVEEEIQELPEELTEDVERQRSPTPELRTPDAGSSHGRVPGTSPRTSQETSLRRRHLSSSSEEGSISKKSKSK